MRQSLCGGRTGRIPRLGERRGMCYFNNMLKPAITLSLLLVIPLSGQSVPSFEVASVKPNKSGDFRRGLGPEPGGRFVAINVPLRDLVALAYGISNLDAEARIIGVREWIARERFDITAKAAGTPAPSEYPPMVKAMLAERFKLQAHEEVRDVQAFALVRARADGTLGPRLRKSDVDCDARRAAAKGGAPLPQPASGPVCTGRTIPGTITATALSMGSLAGGLIRFAGRSVVDETDWPGTTTTSFDGRLTSRPSHGRANRRSSSIPTVRR